MLICAQPSPNSARIVGFDCSTKVTDQQAREAVAAGFIFALRYVPLFNFARGGDLDPAELASLTRAGLRVLGVQHARSAGWSGDLGKKDGAAAAAGAAAAGLPRGTTIFCDLEGQGMSPAQAIDYAASWHDGFLSVAGSAGPGLYVGAGVPLSSDELFHRLPFECYARSCSDVPNVARRGYRLLQLPPCDRTIDGMRVDVDVVCADFFGQWVTWALDPQGAPLGG